MRYFEVLYLESVLTDSPNTAIMRVRACNAIESMKQVITLCKGDCYIMASRELIKLEKGCTNNG